MWCAETIIKKLLKKFHTGRPQYRSGSVTRRQNGIESQQEKLLVEPVAIRYSIF